MPKTKKISLAGSLVLFFSITIPLTVSAQVTIQTLVVSFADLVNLLVPVLITAALVVFLWGAIRYIGAKSDENKIKEGRNFLIFGVLGIAVMVSVWGLVQILLTTLGLDNANMPDIPFLRF